MTADEEVACDFDSLFDAYYRRLARLLYRVTGDTGRAEEIAAEAFWRLYRNPPPSNTKVLIPTFQLLAALPQQTPPSLSANAPAIGVHRCLFGSQILPLLRQLTLPDYLKPEQFRGASSGRCS